MYRAGKGGWVETLIVRSVRVVNFRTIFPTMGGIGLISKGGVRIGATG